MKIYITIFILLFSTYIGNSNTLIVKSKFKIGQTVICIIDGHLSREGDFDGPPVRIGCKYIVQGIKACPCGKDVSVDVGIYEDGSSTLTCNMCNKSYPSDKIWWCDQRRFQLIPVPQKHVQF